MTVKRRRPTTSAALAFVLLASTTLALWQSPPAVAADSPVPTLVSAQVTTPLVQDGEDVIVAWEFNAPIDFVSFHFSDPLGGQRQVTWNGNLADEAVEGLPPGEPAGEAVGHVEVPTWPRGTYTLDGFTLAWDGWRHTASFDGDGNLTWKTEGTGVPDPLPDLSGITFEVVTAVDLSRPPSLSNVALAAAPGGRASGDVLEVRWVSTLPIEGELHVHRFARRCARRPMGRMADRRHRGTCGHRDRAHYECVAARPRDLHRFRLPLAGRVARRELGGGDPVKVPSGLANAGSPFGVGGLGFTVLPKLSATPKPVILGDPVVGTTLEVDAGEWEPSPVQLTYQWLRDGSAIGGATNPSYVVAEDDQGADISVAVTGTKPGHRTATMTSDPLAIPNPTPIRIPIPIPIRIPIPIPIPIRSRSGVHHRAVGGR